MVNNIGANRGARDAYPAFNGTCADEAYNMLEKERLASAAWLLEGAAESAFAIQINGWRC